MKISENKVVKLNYVGTLATGEVFDSSEGREPLEFILGLGMIIPGLEDGLKGLKSGDKKKIKITSDKAYGPRMDEAVQEVPKEHFPKEIPLTVGMQLAAQGPHGVIPVVIAEIKKDTVMVDFNHPLAGKDLVFDVEIVDVRDASKEELEHGHTHGAGGHDSHGHGHAHDDDEEGCCDSGSGCCSEEDGHSKKKSGKECCGSGKCKSNSLEEELDKSSSKDEKKAPAKKSATKKAAKK